MATPNTSLTQLGLSDVNAELNFSVDTARKFDDPIVRNLTGIQSRVAPQSPILISELSDRAAFDGLLTVTSANNADFGMVTTTVNLTADSDMLSPEITWSYNTISVSNGSVSFQSGGKTASLKLISNTIGISSANVQVNVSVSFQGHDIGSDSKYVNLVSEVYDPNLQISGTFTVNNSGFVAQSAVTQVTATSNVAFGTIRFSTSPPFGGVVSGNTISFSAVALQPGVDNNNIFTLTTDLLYNNVVIASNTVDVNVHAIYQQPELTISVPATTNNVFANSGPVDSSIRITSSHFVPGANVVWTATKISGDTATLDVVANNAYANLTLTVATFGAKKSVYDVKASLQYGNGYVVNEKTQRLTLRTAGYGLSFVPAPDQSAQGFGAQTAQSTASASYQAGIFTWDTATISGIVANTSQAVGVATASIILTISANTAGSFNSTNRINSVLKFDDIVIANVSSVTTLTAEFVPFTFNISGPTVNNQVGISPVTSSIFTQATHDISNGYVTWTVDNANVAITSNTSSATLTINTNSVNVQTATLHAKLFDQFNRLITESVRAVTLRTFVPNIRFLGANSASSIGYAFPQTANISVEARCDTGANSFTISTSQISGSPLSVTNFAGNTTFDRVDFSAVSTTFGVTSGTQRINATVNYFGTTFSQTYDITASATLLDPNYTLVSANGQANSFNPPVIASANAVATYSVPGGMIQWSTSLVSGSVLDVPISNNTLYQFRTRRDSFGTTNTTLNITGTLLDSSGLVVKSLTIPVTAIASVSNPQLQLNGANNVVVSNTFQAAANTTLTANVNGSVVGATFQFITQLISGSSASISTSANTITLGVIANGVSTISSTYDVTVNCVISGQTVSSVTRRVFLQANALSPTINFSAANSSSSNFNYPVTANGLVTASTTPTGGTIEWNAVFVSGNTLTVTPSANQITLGASTTNIGAVDGTYDVTATYKTPAGFVITTRTARVNVRAERFNPNFSWDYVQSSIVQQTGWEENITALGQVKASANQSLTGHTFVISSTNVGGEFGNYSTNGTDTATLQLSNNRTANGLNARESTWDITCYVQRSGQTLAGPFTRRLTVRTVPYFIVLSPLNPSSYALDSIAAVSTTATSNHEAFSGTTITWNQVRISGSGTFGFITNNNGGMNNRLIASLSPPANLGTLTATYTVTANFFANGSTRQASTNMTLTAESSFNAGSCVCEDMWLDDNTRASEVKEMQRFLTWSPENGYEETPVEKINRAEEELCVEIETAGGALLRCSTSTPFNLESAKNDLDEGHYVLAGDLHSQKVLVDICGMLFWDEVISVKDIGLRKVVPISFGGRSFAAGENKMSKIFSHNATKYIP